MSYTTPNVLDRVLAKTECGGGCWVWTGHTNDAGYGIISVKAPPGYPHRQKRYRVHRVVYEWTVGPLPEGTEIDHLCANRACVKPSHLEAVTHRENIMRGLWGDSSRREAAKTECKRGHPFTPKNTYRNPASGARVCRTCLALHQREYQARKKAGTR